MKRTIAWLAGWTTDLSVAEKIYGIAAGLMVVTTVLMAMSIQSVRLQTGYRHLQASSAQAATNAGQVNTLIYAIVMESRGIYMSTDRVRMKEYADELLKRNSELAGVMKRWKQTVRADDVEQFTAFNAPSITRSRADEPLRSGAFRSAVRTVSPICSSA